MASQEIKFCKETPRHLYKLMSFGDDNTATPSDAEKLESILINSSLWMADPNNLDDPDEIRANFIRNPDSAAARKRAIAIAANNGVARKYREAFASRIMKNLANPDVDLNAILNSLRGRLGVCSLSSSIKNQRLWSEFGGEHRGIAIQFSTERDVDTFAKAMKVIYTDKVELIPWPSDFSTDALVDNVILRKAESYRDQAEYRLVTAIAGDRHLPIQSRCVTGLILGKRFPADKLRLISQVLSRRERLGMPPVKLLRFADRIGPMKAYALNRV